MKMTKSIVPTYLLVAFFGLLAISPGAVAQQKIYVAPDPPETVVTNLYKQHKRRSPFFQTRSRVLLDQYFEKSLGDLIWKDAIRSKGEVGLLDGDPLFNAQDMEIKNFLIHKATSDNSQMTVRVTFDNFGKAEQVVFVLVSGPRGWKIADIKYSDGTTLVGILKGAPDSPSQGAEIKVYLIALGDNGKSGKKVGCDDSLVPVTRTLGNSAAPLKGALQELLSMPPEAARQPKLENFWKGRNLRLTSVSVRNHLATIHISGQIFVAGICDEPRITGQIEATARQFPNVRRVKVFIGRQTLAAAIR
jgi:hypothetical protein